MAALKKQEINFIIFSIFALLLLFRFQMAHISADVDDHFLLLHTMLELFSIFVSFSLFVQAWITYSTHRLKSQYFIGLVFLAVGCFDLAHTFTYKGMPFINDEFSATRATWFWIVARLIESIGVALFVFRPNQMLFIKRGWGLCVTVLIVSICTTIILTIPEQLPVLLNEQGVTGLKVSLEYVISTTIFITFIILLTRYIKESQPTIDLLRMIFALFIMMVGELFFTLYTHVYAIENLLGHCFKFIAYIYIYRAIYFPEIQQILTDKENAEKQQMDAELKLYEAEKNLSRQVFEAHEEERKRVSRELHDSLGQSLFSILVTLNTVNKDQSVEKNEESVQTIKMMTQEAMKEVKEIARSLRPSALDDLGFIPAMRSYLETYKQIHNISIQFEIKRGVGRLKQEIETALYRICQEALNNTAKYAKASEVYVSLNMGEDSVNLTIKDNGIGFCVEDYLKNAQRKGIGLYSIKERAEGVGGSAQFHSKANEGTTIEIFVPRNVDEKVEPLTC
ncbi:MASE3 domain-containing protein [Solibacillus daqui]|uniref:sensor histidine kinase n=1 Tax=Solibacillus daqui TaxID=2912187 RepID=UPI002366DBC5|nr:MASE3 domain-containing protein [Solibacillus daqui]